MDSHIAFLETMVQNIAGAHAEGIEAGAAMIEKRLYPALRTLDTQYRAAMANKDAKLPTALEIAIIQVLALLPRL